MLLFMLKLSNQQNGRSEPQLRRGGELLKGKGLGVLEKERGCTGDGCDVGIICMRKPD